MLPKSRGKSIQWEKAGGFQQANKDVDSLNLKDVKVGHKVGMRIGTHEDGRTVVVRPSSRGGSPSFDFQNKDGIDKIRYK